jgi:hypothetical protein
MSNTGLHAGLYGELRDFAELVDTVIAEMSTGSTQPAARKKLAERLQEITAPSAGGLLLRYVGPAPSGARQNWADLAIALRQDPAPAWVPDQLENLARLLDRGRSAALERLHGVDVR